MLIAPDCYNIMHKYSVHKYSVHCAQVHNTMIYYRFVFRWHTSSREVGTRTLTGVPRTSSTSSAKPSLSGGYFSRTLQIYLNYISIIKQKISWAYFDAHMSHFGSNFARFFAVGVQIIRYWYALVLSFDSSKCRQSRQFDFCHVDRSRDCMTIDLPKLYFPWLQRHGNAQNIVSMKTVIPYQIIYNVISFV